MSLLSPYLGSSAKTNAGTSMLSGASNPFRHQLEKLTVDSNSISDSESYKFRLSQGQQALQRSAAAKGMLGSGNTLAALMEYGQGMASTEYGNEFDRLTKASQGEDQFNLGKANIANQESQIKNSLANLVLEAGKAKSGDYWKAQEVASKNALATGYLSPNIW